jgi:acylphosphatase
MVPSARFVVSGRVQGVGFRAATRAEARRLGLDGSAVNLADGRVEVRAAGRAEALDALAVWLAHGPPLARVTALERSAATAPVMPGFTLG